MANIFYTLHVGISGVHDTDDTWVNVETTITFTSDTNCMV